MTDPTRSSTREGFRPDLHAMVDLSKTQDWDEPGGGASRFGALTTIEKLTGAATFNEGGEGESVFEPLNLRLHDFHKPHGRTLRDGTPDRRMSLVTVNDYDGDQDEGEDGEAPFGQLKGWTAFNRSTRERDVRGREALPSSLRRIVDADDGRHALALTCPGPDVGGAETVETAGPGDQGEVWPEGVRFVKAGVTRSGPNGSSVVLGDAISIGGLTVLGSAAIEAARRVRDAGGSLTDMARAASAASRGLPPPPMLDAPPDGGTRERPKAPEPKRTPTGSPSWQLDRPGGYVHDGQAIGLLGSVFSPRLQLGVWSRGSEGTPIGPLVRRHDAQVGMPGLVGRELFDPLDVASVPEGRGKLFKGSLFFDSSRANIDTELGHESGQWRPGVRVDAAVPPSKDPPPFVDPRKPKKETGDPGGDPEDGPGPVGPTGGSGFPWPQGGGPTGGGGGGKPKPKVGGEGDGKGGIVPPGAGPYGIFPFGESPGGAGLDSGKGKHKDPCPPDGSRTKPWTATAGGTRPRTEDPTPADGTQSPVSSPVSQVRDFSEGNGTPCINTTAGTRERPNYGHPAVVEQPDGTLGIGGVEADLDRGDFSFGGIEVEEGGFAVPRGSQERKEEEARKKAREKREKEKKEREDKEIKRLEEQADFLEGEAAILRVDGKHATSEWKRRKARLAREKAARIKKAQAERLSAQKAREDYYAKKRQQTIDNLERYRQRNRAADERAGRTKSKAKVSEGAYRMEVQRRPVGAGALDRNRDPQRPVEIAPAAGWGDWNTANSQLKHLGEIGGPTTMEDWAILATETIRSVQSVQRGAFAGSSFYAGNLGVMEESGPGKVNGGNLLGTRTRVRTGENLEPCPPPPALAVVSHLIAEAGALAALAGGGVIEVVRALTGVGASGVKDDRPAILIRNDVGEAAKATGDAIATETGGFRVKADESALAQGLAVQREQGTGSTDPLLQVGTVPSGQKGRNDAAVRPYLEVDKNGNFYLYTADGEPIAVEVGTSSITLTDADGTATTIGAVTPTDPPYQFGGDGSDLDASTASGDIAQDEEIDATTFDGTASTSIYNSAEPSLVIRSQGALDVHGVTLDSAGRGNQGLTTTAGTNGAGCSGGTANGRVSAGGGGGSGGAGGGRNSDMTAGDSSVAGSDGEGCSAALLIPGREGAGGAGATAIWFSTIPGNSGSAATANASAATDAATAIAKLTGPWAHWLPGGASGGAGSGGGASAAATGTYGTGGATMGAAGANGSGDGVPGGGGGPGAGAGNVILEAGGELDEDGTTYDVSGQDGGDGGDGDAGVGSGHGGGAGGGAGGGGAGGAAIRFVGAVAATGTPTVTTTAGQGGTKGSGGASGGGAGVGADGGDGGDGQAGFGVLTSAV
ncbi:MAG: hypothetical protein AB7N76_09590 [Planctomycetota bacterium]